MGGCPDGSREKLRMDPSATSEDIGKLGNGENGMAVLIYLVNLMKTLRLYKCRDPSSGMCILWQTMLILKWNTYVSLCRCLW